MVRKKNKIKAITNEDYYITLEKKDIRNLKVVLKYDGPIVAPIQKGTKIASLNVLNNNELVKNFASLCIRRYKKS